MTILLTGGSGFVGRALAAALLRSGRSVRVLSRKPRDLHRPALPPEVDVSVGDLTNKATLVHALNGVDTVVYLAGALEGSAAAQMRLVNVEGARILAQAVRDIGLPLFVHISSAGVYGDGRGLVAHKEADPLGASSPYELSKRDGERAVIDTLRGSQTAWLVLRPAGIYGGGRAATHAFFHEVIRRRVWIHLPPSVIVHPTYIDDVVQAIVRALDRPDLSGEIFNVGGERALRLDAWISEVARALKVRRYQLVFPAYPATAVARAATKLARAIHVRPPKRLVRAGEPALSRAIDISKIRDRLGFTPAPIEEALRETIVAARALGAL